MHMADALLSPPVGGAMWAATAAATVYCARKVRAEMDPARVPLMGVSGAFVFAAQMLNFTIPGTGASGHLGGGLLLAILLGPHAAFLVMASVLTVQALFFADGGLLALGANIFNLGFFPAFIAYPLIYRPIVGAGANPSRVRLLTGSVLAAVVGLQLGSLAVVLETVLSGISDLPFTAFALLMQPIHLAIGIVEGLVTGAVVLFVARVQPDLLEGAHGRELRSGSGLKSVLMGLAIAAFVSGVAVSWFASAQPDGLEWAIERVAGTAEKDGAESGIHRDAAAVQEETSLLPDYGFKSGGKATPRDAKPAWPSPDAGTSTAGAVGAVITLLFAGVAGFVLSRKRS